MSFSLCRLSWGFSALFISMTVIGSDASAQVHQKLQSNDLSLPINTSEAKAQTRLAQTRDYVGASSMGMSAANQCYQEKEIDECDNLHQIQNTLSNWCAENDQNACELYISLVNYEMSIQSSQMLIEMSEQIQ
jgi:hypothetical protein